MTDMLYPIQAFGPEGADMKTRNTVLGVAVVAALAGASQARAQDKNSTDDVLGEVIVTAQKQATNLQSTAASISVVGGDALSLQQVSTIEGLAQSLPNVNFGQTTGNARIAIRGVGFDNLSLGNEGRVAYHTGGVYISRPAAALASFYDVERVEVLRGPQGTLYGRNATGGAINVLFRKPTAEVNGYVDGAVGNYGLYKLEGGVGGGLTDTVSARASFQVVERDGYGRNLTNGLPVDDQSTRAVRGQIRLQPSDAFDLTLSADYFTEDDHAYSFHYLGAGSRPNASTTPALTGAVPKGLVVGGVAPSDPRDSTSDSGPTNKREFWGVAADATIALGALTLNSLTAYRDSYFHTVTDLDATSARLSVYDQIEDAQQISQELRLSGRFSRGDWMIGGYYFKESLFGGTRVAFDPLVVAAPPLPAPSRLTQGFYGMGDLDTRAYAAFASVRFELTEHAAVRAGARYSNERKAVDEELKVEFVTPYPPFVPFFPPTPPGSRRQISTSWSSVTPSLTLEYQVSDDVFAYATYSKGFKSGGFNLGNLQPPFAPEKLTDYEAGVRADWLGGRLRTNVSAFLYNYKNLQVSKVQGAAIRIENAADASVHGVEAEISALPTERLRIDANVALLDSKFKDFVSSDPARAALGPLNLAGNELTQAPHYTVNLSPSYTLQTASGDVSFRAEGRWVGKMYFTQYNLDFASQPAYSLLNAYVTWKSAGGRWSASVYGRNLADKRIVSAALVGSGLVGFPLVGSLEPPRTYGITVGIDF